MISSSMSCFQLLEARSGRQTSCWQRSCAQGKYTRQAAFLSIFHHHFSPGATCYTMCALTLSLTLLLLILTCIIFLPVIVSSLGLCLQTSSWWTWSFGSRVPQQRSPLALSWLFWLCGLESPCPSPSLVPTLDSRKLWVRPPGKKILIVDKCVCVCNHFPLSFCSFCRRLSNQCEQTKSPVKSQSSHSSQSRSLVSWWVASCPSAASSFSFSLFSTAFGKRQECCLSWLVCSSCFDLLGCSAFYSELCCLTCCLLSLRSHQMYYMFGFLFLVFIILFITCSEATILLCYFHLCAEVPGCSQGFVSFIMLQSEYFNLNFF